MGSVIQPSAWRQFAERRDVNCLDRRRMTRSGRRSSDPRNDGRAEDDWPSLTAPRRESPQKRSLPATEYREPVASAEAVEGN